MSVRWAFEENTTDVLDVSKFQSLATEALREKEGWVGISGGYKQYNLLKLPQGKKLQRELAELAQSVLKALSKGPTNLVPKHFKLLKANPWVRTTSPASGWVE
jgi:hypothetical protein